MTFLFFLYFHIWLLLFFDFSERILFNANHAPIEYSVFNLELRCPF